MIITSPYGSIPVCVEYRDGTLHRHRRAPNTRINIMHPFLEKIEMQGVPWRDSGENDAHFYCLAYCEGNYNNPRQLQPGSLAMYYCPNPEFSRFSFQMRALDGAMLSYSRGPDYTHNVEAALLTVWTTENIPPHAWYLYPQAAIGDFACTEHADYYRRARDELCMSLRMPKLSAALHPDASKYAHYAPPQGGFDSNRIYANDAESMELTNVMIAHVDPPRSE